MSTSRSMPPTRRHAPVEEESLFQWIRRQRHADRKPTPPRGITQTAPARVLDAMATAVTNKNAPDAGQGVEGDTTNQEKPHV